MRNWDQSASAQPSAFGKTLDKITDIQVKYLLGTDRKRVFKDLLEAIISETESEYGFIGEVIDGDSGPFLKTYEITNIAWNEETRRYFGENAENGLVFSNLDTLFGACIRTRDFVIANDAPSDPRGSGVPNGHPPLNHFLGIPLLARDEMIGMVGIANRPGGYDDDLLERIEPLVATSTALVHSFRSERSAADAEQKLSAEQKRLQEILLGTNAGTWEWNVATGETLFNERWAEIIDYTLEELAPISIETWLQHCHPEDLAESNRLLQKHFSGEIPYYDIQLRMRHKEGHWIWVHDRGKVVEWSDAGDPLRVAGTHTDITTQKAVETQLVEAKFEAERASESKSEFLASMSHELRTPLNAVIGYGQLLQLDLDKNLTATQDDYIGHIVDAGNHLLALVNDILDLAKIEADRLSITPEEVHPNEVFRECIDHLKLQAEDKNIRVVNNLEDADLEPVITDKIRLRQIVINLLSNAYKYNNVGGQVTISGQRLANDYLRIAIHDTGIGIPKERHHDLFKLFNRLVEDSMLAVDGIGIGLAVSKMLVDRMGGHIDFESKVDVGSTFWFDLPLATNKGVLIWTDQLRVGVDPIDKDHQVIFRLTNKVSYFNLNDEEMTAVLEELIAYTHYHFRREEAIMSACGYPDLAEHASYHRALEQKVDDMAVRWRNSDDADALRELRNFLRDWWTNHILEVDKTIAQYASGKKATIESSILGLS